MSIRNLLERRGAIKADLETIHGANPDGGLQGEAHPLGYTDRRTGDRGITDGPPGDH